MIFISLKQDNFMMETMETVDKFCTEEKYHLHCPLYTHCIFCICVCCQKHIKVKLYLFCSVKTVISPGCWCKVQLDNRSKIRKLYQRHWKGPKRAYSVISHVLLSMVEWENLTEHSESSECMCYKHHCLESFSLKKELQREWKNICYYFFSDSSSGSG